MSDYRPRGMGRHLPLAAYRASEAGRGLIDAGKALADSGIELADPE